MASCAARVKAPNVHRVRVVSPAAGVKVSDVDGVGMVPGSVNDIVISAALPSVRSAHRSVVVAGRVALAFGAVGIVIRRCEPMIVVTIGRCVGIRRIYAVAVAACAVG